MNGPGRVLLVTADRNQHLHDFTGAFRPEAEAFIHCHAPKGSVVTWVKFDPSKPYRARRKQVLAALDAAGPLDSVVFMGHGWRNGIQSGFLVPNIPELAARLVAHGTKVVVLYSCDTARDPDDDRHDDMTDPVGGDMGFADRLRDACQVYGGEVTVLGHPEVAHTTKCPFVRRFAGDDHVGLGGPWVFTPRSELWAGWVFALKKTDLRFRFPWMTHDEILADIRSRGRP